MSTWAERVHRRAADFSSVVTSCGHPASSASAYPYRLEKVKFGVPLEEVCKNDNIPGPLLVLILKLNKESPNRRDVFRAPGHQGAMKKLIHFLQAGRLVNVDNYSVYTIASVLKKFLRKIPHGVFGRNGENELFAIIELDNESQQTKRLHNLFTSLPKYTQHLLVLLFGTFRVIASNAVHAGTGMTSEALGVSVAPSFFQSCVSDGKTARMEDVLKFKVATKIMKYIIDKFATQDIFGRENYEYYARVTGRILKVQDEWICSFQYPPPPRGKVAQQKYALQHSLEAEKTWLQCQCERWGLLAQEESRSTPALLTSSSSALDNSIVSLGVTPEHSFMESCARLSVSLEGPGLFAMTSSPLPTARHINDLPVDDPYNDDDDDDDDDDEIDGNDDIDDNENDNDEGEDDIDNANNDNNSSSYQENQENYNRKYNSTNERNGKIRKLKKSLHVENASNKSVLMKGERTGRGGGGLQLDEECDTEMRPVVKRRYRPNKNKVSNSASAQLRVQLQQQRRFRSNKNPIGSKSLDDEHYPIKSNNGTSSVDHTKTELKDIATSTGAAAFRSHLEARDMTGSIKNRFCSRCRRGIRHSSSCSSSTPSSGAGNSTNPNGSGMTMEELRAVNRYAESTKSLSYLPQVHERQTARMRTRSEWFLGPKVGDLLCCGNVANDIMPMTQTCSNYYLQQQQQHELHIQQQQQFLQPISYLGGGSTQDMRHTEIHTPVEAINTSLFMYYKQQLQQQQQLNRQSFHSALEHMDTNDEMDNIAATPCFTHSIQKQQKQHSSPYLTTGETVASSPMLLNTNYVGNIRLSNSAESVQFPVRRPSTRRILLGANIPRQYPLRSSLRRHKEKQVGTLAGNTTSTTTTTNNSTTSINRPAKHSSIVDNSSGSRNIKATGITTASIYYHQPDTPIANPITADYKLIITSLQQQQKPKDTQSNSGWESGTSFKAPRL